MSKKKEKIEQIKQPIQPLYKTETGTLRFHPNAIVDYLLEYSKSKGCGLNELSMMPFSNDDRQHFAQLIGYSLCGYSELSYHDEETYCAAESMYKENLSEKDAKIKYLEEELSALKESLREPMARLFHKHPDDLMEQ